MVKSFSKRIFVAVLVFAALFACVLAAGFLPRQANRIAASADDTKGQARAADSVTEAELAAIGYRFEDGYSIQGGIAGNGGAMGAACDPTIPGGTSQQNNAQGSQGFARPVNYVSVPGNLPLKALANTIGGVNYRYIFFNLQPFNVSREIQPFKISADGAGASAPVSYTALQLSSGWYWGNAVIYAGIPQNVSAFRKDAAGRIYYPYDDGNKTKTFYLSPNGLSDDPGSIATETIAISNITKTYGDAAFALSSTATGAGTGAITYTSSDPSKASISGTTCTIKGAGTVTITATKAPSPGFTGASATATLTINKKTETIAMANITKTFGDAAFTLALSSNAGGGTGAVTYTSSNTNVASISGTTCTIKAAGTVTITATKAAGTNHTGATTTATLTINKKSVAKPTAIAATTYTGASQTVYPSGWDVATMNISGNVQTDAKTSHTVTLSLKNTTNYQWADGTTANITLPWTMKTSAFTPSTVSVENIANVTYKGSAHTPLPVVKLDSVTLVKDTHYTVGWSNNVNAGSATVTVTAKGANFTAGSVTKPFTIAKATPTFSISNKITDWALKAADNTYALSTSASTGVTYASDNPSVATVTPGGVISFLQSGTVKITASLAESANYKAASDFITVKASESVAKHTTSGNVVTYYSTLDAAFENAASGGTVELLQDCTLDKKIFFGGTLEGSITSAPKLTVTGGANKYKLTVTKSGAFSTGEGAEVTFRDIVLEGGSKWSGNVNNNADAIRGALSLIATNKNSKLNLDGVTVQNFDAGSAYGLIKSAGGVITINDSVIQNNRAQMGGALCTYDTADATTDSVINVNNSQILGNSAALAGGAITLYGQRGEVKLNSSTVTNNTAGLFGDAVYMIYGSTLRIVNTTVDGTIYLGANSAPMGSGLVAGQNLSKVLVSGAAMANQLVLDVAADSLKYYADEVKAGRTPSFVLVESEDKAMTSAQLKEKVRIKNGGYTAKVVSVPESNALYLMATTEFVAAVIESGNIEDGTTDITGYLSLQGAIDAQKGITGTVTIYIIDSFNEAAGLWVNDKTVKLVESVTVPAGMDLVLKSAQRHVAADGTTVTLKAMPAGEKLTLLRLDGVRSAMLTVEKGAALTAEGLIIDGGAVWDTSVANSIKMTGTGAGAVAYQNGGNAGVYANAPILKNFGSLTLKDGVTLQNNENKFLLFGSVNYGGGIANIGGARLIVESGAVIKDCYAREGGGIQNINGGKDTAFSGDNSVTVNGEITGCVSHTKGGAVETIYGSATTILGADAKIENNVSLMNYGVVTVEDGGVVSIDGATVKAVGSDYSIYVYNKYAKADLATTLPNGDTVYAYVEGKAAAELKIAGAAAVTGAIYLGDNCLATFGEPEQQLLYAPFVDVTGYTGTAKIKIVVNSTKGLGSYIAKGAIDKVEAEVKTVVTKTIGAAFAYKASDTELKMGGFEAEIIQVGLDQFEVTGSALGLSSVTINGKTYTVKPDGTFAGSFSRDEITVGGDQYANIEIKYTPEGSTEQTGNFKLGVLTMDSNYNILAPAGTTYLTASQTTAPLENSLLPNNILIDENGRLTFYIEGDSRLLVSIPARALTPPGGGRLTDITSTSLTVTTEAGVEYIVIDKDGNPVGNWADDTTDGTSNGTHTFTGLSPESEYRVLRRVKAGENIAPGEYVVGDPYKTLAAGETSQQELTAFLAEYANLIAAGKLAPTDNGAITAKSDFDSINALYGQLSPTLKAIVEPQWLEVLRAQTAYDLKVEYEGYTEGDYYANDWAALTAIYDKERAVIFAAISQAEAEEHFEKGRDDMAAVPKKGDRLTEYGEKFDKLIGVGDDGLLDVLQPIVDEGKQLIRDPSVTTVKDIEDILAQTELKLEKERAKKAIEQEYERITQLLPYPGLSDEAKKAIEDEKKAVIKAIEEAETLAEVRTAKEDGLTSVKESYDDQITAVRDKAKAEIEKKYKQITEGENYGRYTSTEKKAIQDQKEAALKAIDDTEEDGDFYTNIGKAQSDGIFKLTYEQAVAELNAYRAAGDSAEVKKIIDDAVQALKDGVNGDPDAQPPVLPTITTVQQIDDLVTAAKADADLGRYRDKKLKELAELYEELKNSGKYGADGLAELKTIFDGNNGATAGSASENIKNAATQETIDAAFTKGKNDLLAVKVSSIGTGGAKPGESSGGNLPGGAFDYPDDKTDDVLAGTVENPNGMASDIVLEIKKNNEDAKKKVEDAVKNGTIKSAEGNTLTAEQAKSRLQGKELKATFDIRLIYEDGGVVPNEELNGAYTVKILLPKNMRNMRSLQIIYIGDDGTVEVYETEREGNYLTFTTVHFSSYMVLGEPEINLWWLIILLIVIILLEIAFILLWHLVFAKRLSGKDDGSDGGEKQDGDKEEKANGNANAKPVKTYSVALPLLLGAVLVPSGAIPAIVILGVAALALGAYIVYMVLKTLRPRAAAAEGQTEEAQPAAEQPSKAEIAPCTPAEQETAEANDYILPEQTEEQPSQEEIAACESPAAGEPLPVAHVMPIVPLVPVVVSRFQITRRDLLDHIELMAENTKSFPVPAFTRLRLRARACDSFRCGEAWSFGVLFESKDEVLKMFLRLPKAYAEGLKERHPGLVPTEFGGGKEWYKVIIDDTFTAKSQAYELLEKAYCYVLESKYTRLGSGEYVTDAKDSADEEALHEAIAAAARKKDEQMLAVAAKKLELDALILLGMSFKPTKAEISDEALSRFGEEEVLVMRRDLATRTGLPLADTIKSLHGISPKGRKAKSCFAYIYQQKEGGIKLIVKLDGQTADSLMEAHPSLARSKFPRAKNWFVLRVDGTFKGMDEVAEILAQAKRFAEQPPEILS